MSHLDLAAGKWEQMSISEQLANIGSEVGRALNAQASGNTARQESALIRAFELFDLTIGSASIRPSARREAARARELVVDWFYGGNEYKTNPEMWNKYFNEFAVVVNSKHF
ncbi:MAG: hypothetical protein AAB657_04590 [Patescibacteria group bacterium]